MSIFTKKCYWSGRGFSANYKTACGHEFHDNSETGNPVTDWLSYCPYCSKRVEVEADGKPIGGCGE
jgi:hypothetical protein